MNMDSARMVGMYKSQKAAWELRAETEAAEAAETSAEVVLKS